MNIFQAFRVWRKITPLVKLFKEMSVNKPFWTSKTIWMNILTASIELSGVLGGLVPAGTLQLVTNVLGIALRLITSQPVTILPASSDGD